LNVDDAFRVVNIYATRLRDAKADRSIGALGSVGVPIVDSKWPFGGLASHLRDAGPQCARVVPAEGWAVDPVTVPTESSSVPRAYDVAECRLWLLAIPYTGFVVVLVATARGDEAAAVQLLNDTFFRRARITLGKDAIVDALHPLWAEDARERRADPPPCLDLDLDAHQLLVLRDRRLLQHAGGRLDEGRVRTILFRGERSEPRFGKVMRPVGANRAPGVVVALRSA
jgi:hypothetical protein